MGLTSGVKADVVLTLPSCVPQVHDVSLIGVELGCIVEVTGG